MNHSQLAHSIVEAAVTADQVVIHTPFDLRTERQNQFLFFFKPEIFAQLNAAQAAVAIAAALTSLSAFAVDIHGVMALSGAFLGASGIMERHYGYINKLSNAASRELDDDDRGRIAQPLGVDGRAPIFGGHEFLRDHPQFDPRSLNAFWATKKSLKLRSGLYVQAYELPGAGPFVLVNGFHPEQIDHFVAPDRRLVVLLLASDLPWRSLRSRMLGDTFPERALPGSIRRNYLDGAATFGLQEISVASNCTHMSAGPFEGMFEVDNFLTPACAGGFDLKECNVMRLGRRAGVPPDALATALRNPTLEIQGNAVALFDATEELDTLSALALFQRYCL